MESLDRYRDSRWGKNKPPRRLISLYNTIYLILGAIIHHTQWDRDAGRPPWEVSLQKQYQQTNDTLDGA